MSAVVKVVILGDDASLKKTLASSRNALSAWNKSLQSIGNAGRAMTTVGRNLTQGITVPVLATGAAAVKLAYDFDKSMTTIKTLVGASDKQMAQYKRGVLDMAKTTGQAPAALADALYFVTSSGYSGAQALDILKQSAMGASTGLGETKQVADFVTTAMSVYGPKVVDAAKAMDVLNKAVKEGKAEPAEFAQYLGKVLSTAERLSVPINDVSAAVASMTLKGIDAGRATTDLRQLFIRLQNPAGKTEETLHKLGTSSAALRKEIKDKGLLSTLEELDQKIRKTGDPNKTEGEIFRNAWSKEAFEKLTGTNSGQTDQVFASLRQSSGAAKQSFDDWAKSIQGKFHIAMATLKSDMTDIGGVALPKLVDWLDRSVKWFQKLDPETKKQAGKFLLIAAAIGPVLMVGGKLLTTFSLIAQHPIVTMLALLGTYLIKLYVQNESFRNSVNGVAHALSGATQWINAHRVAIAAVLIPLATFVGVAYTITKAIKMWRTAQIALNLAMSTNPIVLAIAAIAALVVGVIYCYKHFETFRKVVNGTWSWIKNHWPLLLDIVAGPIGMAAGIIIGHWDAIKSGAEHLKDGIVSAFHAIESPVIAVFDHIKSAWDATIGQLHVPAAVSKVGGLIGKVGGAVSGAAGVIAGARASGGPVSSGNTYLVGENGPELVTMGSSGYVSDAAATAKIFGKVTADPDGHLATLTKTKNTQKREYDNAARRYNQLLARPHKTQAQKDALANAKATMDQQKSDYDAAVKALKSEQKADKALQAQYKKGAPLLTKAAALVGVGDVVGPVEKQANKLADQIRKQFADKDGNIPDAAQAAIDRINDLAQQAATARQGLVSSLTGSSDFVQQFSAGGSPNDVKSFLQGQVDKIKRLGNDLKILSARGLPPSMIQQLAAGGLDALPIADSLASSRSADLAQIVSLQSQINTLSNALGDSTEKAVFSAPASPTGDLTGTVIRDAPAGTVNNINITAQTNASAAQIAADTAWHLRTVSA